MLENLFSKIPFFVVLIVASVSTIGIIRSLATNYEPSLAYKSAYWLSNTSYNIYFLETNENASRFSYRQLCAIESAAKHNPNAIVQTYSLKAKLQDPHLFDKYLNIKFDRINIDDYLYNTPLHNLTNFLRSHKSWKATNSYYHMAHVADALRLATVYKYGGFYSDLDTITIRNFEPLSNYCGFCFDNWQHTDLTNSFFVCKKSHPILHRLMEMYLADYDGKWTTVGPLLIKKHLPVFCNVSNADLLVGKSQQRKCNVVTFPYMYHTPIHWSKISSLFDASRPLYAHDLKDAYQIHFNTYITNSKAVNWNSSNFYEFFASLNCPLVNKLANDGSLV
jgi:lactosylceramide 4-alpha-galactosyltransferase